MTSNIGSAQIQELKGKGAEEWEFEAAVKDMLKTFFRPEFLNRIDEIIVFHPLSMEHVKAIVDLMMKRVTEQLKAKDIEIVLTDQAKDLIASKGYDPALGARPLRRTIQRMIEDPLSEKLLWKEFTAATTIIGDAVGDEITFSSAPTPPDTPPVELAGQQEA